MPAVAAHDSLIGFVLADKYRIVRQIGRGGMGVVYEAEHMALGKHVAIKLMLEKYADDNEAIARFQREALAASRIGNPHIIDVSDIGTAPDGRSFVVMELLNGMPLTQVLEMTGPMPLWRAVGIMRQVLRAVGAAHAKGIIHRDLKPDNIFLVGQGDQHDYVKLLDFGISKVVDPDEQVAFTKLTSTGVVMGTPLYMAPEQAMGQSIDAAVDIYACGVMLYELLAGRPPFEGQTYAVLVAKLLTQPPEYLGNLRAGLPLALVNAVHRALEKEPHRRFATAEQFAAALPGDRTPSQIELAGTLDSGVAVPRVPPQPGSKKTWLAVGGALVLGAATAGVLIATQTGASTPTTPQKPARVESEAPKPAPKAEVQPPAPAPAPVGTLSIQTMPEHAKVFIDKRELGEAPLNVTLAPGKHALRLELGGYDELSMNVDVTAGQTTTIVAPLGKIAAAAPAKKPTTITTPGTKKSTIDLSVLKPLPIDAKTPEKPDPGPGTTAAKTTKSTKVPAKDPEDVAPPKVKPLPQTTSPTGAKPNPY